VWVSAVGFGRRPLSVRSCDNVQESCSCWPCSISIWALSFTWSEANPAPGMMTCINLIIFGILICNLPCLVWVRRWLVNWSVSYICMINEVCCQEKLLIFQCIYYAGAISDASKSIWVSLQQLLWGDSSEWRHYEWQTSLANWLSLACSQQANVLLRPGRELGAKEKFVR
jgi:hypothetical protein